MVLGQADDRRRAEAVVQKYRTPDAALAALAETRRWWLGRLETIRGRTGSPAFDGYVDWLHYQALAERLWARRGFYQASGAYGFRDQLQDAVNLLWADPSLARRQIVLHAGQQFLEGDVAHWFHLLPDGRTGMVGRTYASDTLVWLPWAVVEYSAATGDDTVLDERPPTWRPSSRFHHCRAARRHGLRATPPGPRRRCLPALSAGSRSRLGRPDGRTRAAAHAQRRLERRARRDR